MRAINARDAQLIDLHKRRVVCCARVKAGSSHSHELAKIKREIARVMTSGEKKVTKIDSI